jgi:hypothetical protein
MAEHFLFHHGASEVVPFTAKYAYPSQATRSQKTLTKIQPKGLQTYQQGNIMRIEFPASGYLSAQNSTLQFDVATHVTNVKSSANTKYLWAAVPGTAHAFIKRLRVLYGSVVLEDIRDYNTLTALITNHTVSPAVAGSSAAIGAGGYQGWEENLSSDIERHVGWLRATKIGGSPGQLPSDTELTPMTFCLNLMSGLLTNQKLIPLKWLSSQLAIEIEFAGKYEVFNTYTGATTATAPTQALIKAYTDTEAIAAVTGFTTISDTPGDTTVPVLAGYSIGNVAFNAELLEFDSAYDAAFFQGLATGVPIKFHSWHTFNYGITQSTNVNVQIQERSRSVQMALWTFRQATATSNLDYVNNTWKQNTDTYQWRIGGKYFPAQPVRCKGYASEAHVELKKSLQILGDYESQKNIGPIAFNKNLIADFPARWVAGTDLRTTTGSGADLNGLNAEEQSDMNLQLYSSSTNINPDGILLSVFVMYDALLVIKQNNQIDLIM